MSGFKVINAGIQTTVQDHGRMGYGSIGLSSAGAMDEFAYNWANKLLGNPYSTNTLEIVFGGVKLRAAGDITFVLTGAQVDAKIDGQSIECWKTCNIKNDQVLELGFASSGARVYLSVYGGFDVPLEYGSASISIKEGIGGFDGKALKANDFLPYKSEHLKDNRKLPTKHHQNYDDTLTLRVIAGYQWDMFKKEEQNKFFDSVYKVTSQNDRMGYRLEGEKIKASSGGVISEPIAYGSIQIPSHGEPIVLLKERQTIGGYPKIGSVIPVDCFKLSQMKQNSVINFKLIEKEEAREISKKFHSFFK